MPNSQWQKNRTEIENQIKNNFSEFKKKLDNLKSQIQSVKDETEKQKKQAEIQKLEKELVEIKGLIDRLSSLQDQELQSLKTRLEQYVQVKQDVRVETADLLKQKTLTPTTYELLKDSETCSRLVTIISSNPKEFQKIPWATPEAKLEYIFTKIRRSVVLFLKNKLWKAEKYDKVINNTIAPALEWSMMEMLRDQGNETNVSMLKWMDKISWDSFNKLLSWVSKFATDTKWSFNKFNQWVNAIDYLSVHNGVLNKPEKSEVLSSPIEFKKYLNDPLFASEKFSPYTSIDNNIFKVNESQTFEFWISLQQKREILNEIWNIKVENNSKTASLVAKMINKPEKFLWATSGLQKTANSLLNWVNAINSVTKIFWVDILWEISKAPEQRSFLYKIIDFVCKLIWITWWLEWIVKRWRLDRLNLTDDKNENISLIFGEYQKLIWKWGDLSITDENSCKTALADFEVTDLDKQSTTKWDHLRDVIYDNIDIDLISPYAVQQTLWNSYLKKDVVIVDWKRREEVTVDDSKITEKKKKELIHKHIINMKTHLVEKYDDLKDFYSNIHSVDDLALCITASLYADKDDVIEWIKAKVFLPENYVVNYEVDSNGWWSNGWNFGWGRNRRTVWWTIWWWSNNWWSSETRYTRYQWWGNRTQTINGWQNLDSRESADKQVVSEKWMYDKAVEYWITDKRQIAYVLSTVKWESGFKNQKEIWWEKKSYGRVDPSTWKAYYGRWFIQLTHKYNYQKYTQIIQSSWKDFKDNNWNILKWRQIDLVHNPDVILQSNDLAAFIIMDWMKNWWPDRSEKKKLSYYINDNKTDYYNARSIVNGMSSKPQKFANDALAYQNKLWKWSVDSPIESNDLLIWPHLLAHNKNEIWWLWNSIMNWFQWLNAKSNFPNMDWVVWKNTLTHPRRFKSKNDVLAYKNSHSNIKSFMFYFGANNDNNQQTISDITKRSEWLQEVWIQPVLTTCIWENSTKTPWLRDLNQKMIALWRKRNRPVLDFAKSYSKWDISLRSDWLHPKSYSPMTGIIDEQLSLA